MNRILEEYLFIIKKDIIRLKDNIEVLEYDLDRLKNELNNNKIETI